MPCTKSKIHFSYRESVFYFETLLKILKYRNDKKNIFKYYSASHLSNAQIGIIPLTST